MPKCGGVICVSTQGCAAARSKARAVALERAAQAHASFEAEVTRGHVAATVGGVIGYLRDLLWELPVAASAAEKVVEVRAFFVFADRRPRI